MEYGAYQSNRSSGHHAQGDPAPVPDSCCWDCFMEASTTGACRSAQGDIAPRAAPQRTRSSRSGIGTWRRVALGLGVLGTEGSVICAHQAYAILLAATEIGGAVIVALILLTAIL